MSILIQGMEMPKNCSGCPLNYDQMACKVTGTRWWSDTMVLMGFDSDKERLYDCPLVEIPTPHGRLIAEKTITEIRYHDADGYHIVNGEQLCELEIDAPTVIEAEGSEE